MYGVRALKQLKTIHRKTRNEKLAESEAYEKILRQKGKENQKLSEGRGKKGCQNSDNLNPIDTKQELASALNVSHDTMMIYRCKKCSREISLFEIDFEGESFCECGGMEMTFLRAGSNHEPKKKDTLTLIFEGVRDHYRAV